MVGCAAKLGRFLICGLLACIHSGAVQYWVMEVTLASSCNRLAAMEAICEQAAIPILEWFGGQPTRVAHLGSMDSGLPACCVLATSSISPPNNQAPGAAHRPSRISL
jgi:hypothetical protein